MECKTFYGLKSLVLNSYQVFQHMSHISMWSITCRKYGICHLRINSEPSYHLLHSLIPNLTERHKGYHGNPNTMLANAEQGQYRPNMEALGKRARKITRVEFRLALASTTTITTLPLSTTTTTTTTYECKTTNILVCPVIAIVWGLY